MIPPLTFEVLLCDASPGNATTLYEEVLLRLGRALGEFLPVVTEELSMRESFRIDFVRDLMINVGVTGLS